MIPHPTPHFWLAVRVGLVSKHPTWSEFQILFHFSEVRNMFQMLDPGRINFIQIILFLVSAPLSLQ